MKSSPSRVARVPSLRNRIITPSSPEFSVSALLRNTQGHTSGQWFSANDPLALSFAISDGLLVDRLGWINGNSAGGGVDIGIYDRSWNRLVSSGSVTGSGNAVWQWSNVTDTYLPPGRYYLVYVRDNTTANRTIWYTHTASVRLTSLHGHQDSSTDAFTLPNPLTNMAAASTATLTPAVGIAGRAPF